MLAKRARHPRVDLGSPFAFESNLLAGVDKLLDLLQVQLSGLPGIHLTQVTPTSCSWAHSVLASQSATIERYGVGSTAMACCTRR